MYARAREDQEFLQQVIARPKSFPFTGVGTQSLGIMCVASEAYI